MTTPCPRRSGLAALLCAMSLFPAGALAQERDEEQRDTRDRIVTVGMGADLTPNYPGSNAYSFGPFPDFGIRREGEEPAFEAGDESAGFAILNLGPISIGPAAAIVYGRRQEEVGAPIAEVDLTYEVGLFVEAFLTEHLRLRAEARRGINGHSSWTGDIGADFIIHLAEASHLAIGPRLRIGEDRFMDTYFGVTPAVAAAAALPQFDPGGGIWSAGATASFNTELSQSWGLYGYARYERLVGDAADSPIVRSFGSRNQFGVGLGLSYSFRLRSRR